MPQPDRFIPSPQRDQASHRPTRGVVESGRAGGCSGGEIQEMDSRQLNGQVLGTGVLQCLIVKLWSIIIMYFCLFGLIKYYKYFK